jgi:hypothetical protein
MWSPSRRIVEATRQVKQAEARSFPTVFPRRSYWRVLE